MAEITQINIDSVVYDIRDPSKAPLTSPALAGTPTAPTPSSGDDSTKIATTEYVQGEISKQSKKIQYFYQQVVSAATSAQIMRIPASGTSNDINTDTVLVRVEWANPSVITSGVAWKSFDGYITFTGTCTTATTANVVLGQKGN